MNNVTGRYIVADPDICHGEPTFRNTRILVRDVLEQVAMGLDWESICDQWRGAITKDSISEAVRLAGRSIGQNSDEVVTELSGE